TKMVQRLTYRRRLSYNTKSNRRRMIVRAFLIEEQKIVYKVMKAQQASAKTKKLDK
ncbi:hypothetical protein DMN91_000756, partial [Ooceraea biroi]